jgi:hypothetical protein
VPSTAHSNKAGEAVEVSLNEPNDDVDTASGVNINCAVPGLAAGTYHVVTVGGATVLPMQASERDATTVTLCAEPVVIDCSRDTRSHNKVQLAPSTEYETQSIAAAVHDHVSQAVPLIILILASTAGSSATQSMTAQGTLLTMPSMPLSDVPRISIV